MQTIEINSHKISRVFYQRFLLTVELKTGEKFLYKTVVQETFNDFMNADDKDKFYKTHIRFNDGFKRIQLFGWLIKTAIWRIKLLGCLEIYRLVLKRS